jgi:hypothetical protein
MSISGISGSSFFQTYNSGAAQTKFQEFQQPFLKLGQDLQSGNLSQAQGDFATLQQNAPAGSPLALSSSASSSGTSPISQEFSPLGQDLQSGNLQSAQQAYVLLQQDFQQFAALGGVPGAPSTLRFEPSALHPCANSSGETAKPRRFRLLVILSIDKVQMVRDPSCLECPELGHPLPRIGQGAPVQVPLISRN